MIYRLINPESPILKICLSDVDLNSLKESSLQLTPQELYDNLLESMQHHGGIGLSANQCGFAIRAFVMYTDWESKKHEIYFNPKLTWESEETELYEEGCLTYPYLFLNIKRPSVIEFTYQDVNGEEFIQKYSGLTARVFQHEYDHMEGKNFTQLVSPLKLDIAKRKATKTIKQKQRSNKK
tara:strand:- start:55 stop:594 length:540 start_codon:yes stop_codon:yes gene_type:complete